MPATHKFKKITISKTKSSREVLVRENNELKQNTYKIDNHDNNDRRSLSVSSSSSLSSVQRELLDSGEADEEEEDDDYTVKMQQTCIAPYEEISITDDKQKKVMFMESNVYDEITIKKESKINFWNKSKNLNEITKPQKFTISTKFLRKSRNKHKNANSIAPLTSVSIQNELKHSIPHHQHICQQIDDSNAKFKDFSIDSLLNK